jgi:hypothetical protein
MRGDTEKIKKKYSIEPVKRRRNISSIPQAMIFWYVLFVFVGNS